ncbi:MAG: alpha/beta hydrolase [Oscillospiraceae bacterium]
MALLQMQYFSQILQKGTGMNVILPDVCYGADNQQANRKEINVVYLLHGLSDDFTSWQRKTAVERYAAEYNLAVIMPDAARSFYCNEVLGGAYLQHIAEEVPFVVKEMLGIEETKGKTFVAGLSMGGYGALKLALQYPARFAAAASFSGAADIADAFSILDVLQDKQRIFGDLQALKGSEHDLYTIAQKEKSALPRLYIACGTQDFFYGQHQAFCAFLEGRGYDVNRVDTQGAQHEWNYWDAQLPNALHWMMGQKQL